NAEGPLDRNELVTIDAWWRAANYLAVGLDLSGGEQMPPGATTAPTIKPRPLGHFGTVPGLNLVSLNDAVAVTVGDDATGVAPAGDRGGSGRCGQTWPSTRNASKPLTCSPATGSTRR